MTNGNEKNYSRLSDRILSALQLALDQKDVVISECLVRALELAMTRKAGGAGFKEKREYPLAMTEAMNRFDELKSH